MYEFLEAERAGYTIQLPANSVLQRNMARQPRRDTLGVLGFWFPELQSQWGYREGAEILALDGDFHEGGERFEAQSWLCLPAGSTLQANAGPEGGKVWAKTGHLLHIESLSRSRPAKIR